MNQQGLSGVVRAMGGWDSLARLVVAAAFVVAFSVAAPGFDTLNNVHAVLLTAAPVGLAALGIGTTMIAGEIDLSIGSMAVLGGVISIRLGDHGLIVALVVPALIGLVVGASQGLAIAALNISSLVLTIGSSILLSGLAYIASGENAISLSNFSISVSLQATYWVLAPFSIVFIALTAALSVFLRYSSLGRQIYAVGGGRKEAVAAGIPLRRPMVTVFAFSGCLGAVVGALSSLATGGASPTAFSDLLISGVTAAVIGGVALSGGRGGAWGIALGAICLGIISDGVALLGAQYYVYEVVVGALLLTVLVAEMVAMRRRGRRPRWWPGSADNVVAQAAGAGMSQ
jgi:ribose transport system permease protein